MSPARTSSRNSRLNSTLRTLAGQKCPRPPRDGFRGLLVGCVVGQPVEDVDAAVVEGLLEPLQVPANRVRAALTAEQEDVRSDRVVPVKAVVKRSDLLVLGHVRFEQGVEAVPLWLAYSRPHD